MCGPWPVASTAADPLFFLKVGDNAQAYPAVPGIFALKPSTMLVRRTPSHPVLCSRLLPLPVLPPDFRGLLLHMPVGEVSQVLVVYWMFRRRMRGKEGLESTVVAGWPAGT